MAARPRTVIVGAGLGGCLLAHLLGSRGYPVRVFERRPDPRLKGAVGGRSINLAISARGFHALDRGGLGDRMREQSIRMPGRMVHPPAAADGAVTPRFQPYSHDPSRAIHSVSRSRLNLLLIEAAAAHPSVEFLFDHRCVDALPAQNRVSFERSGSRLDVDADMIIGADGAYSALRSVMEKNEGFDYSQSYLEHGYKELHIPPVTEGPHAPFAMPPNALHIWPRGSSMMISLPNPDGSFTCTLFWPNRRDPARPEQPSFEAIRSGADAAAYFRSHYPDAVALMPTLEQDFQQNPVGAMVTMRCWPWVWCERTALLGDAAHAIVPFYGQGANASFEDCECLVDCLEARDDDVPSALRDYQLRRKRHSDAIAQMALNNFVEMRDKTATRAFRWRKRVEHTLHGLLPRSYEPLYDMVSFSTIPYADAQARAQRQDRIVISAAAAIAVVLLIIIVALAWRILA